MKFHFYSEGGFAGLARQYSTDSASLPDDIKSAFQSLVDDNQKYQQISSTQLARGADIMTYRFEIEMNNSLVVYSFREQHIPPELESLIIYCSERANADG